MLLHRGFSKMGNQELVNHLHEINAGDDASVERLNAKHGLLAET